MFTFIVYTIFSSLGSCPSSTSSIMLTVIVIVFSPTDKLSAPSIFIVAFSKFGFTSINNLSTQYSKSSNVYSNVFASNFGLKGISIVFPS